MKREEDNVVDMGTKEGIKGGEEVEKGRPEDI